MSSFQWSGTGIEREFASAKYNKLVPVNYKEDWRLVREIDDAIGSVHKLPTSAPSSTTQPATQTASR